MDDSWLAIRTPAELLLNVNDCLITTELEMTEILAAIGRPPDVLASQFSYASWVGNPDDVAAHEEAAREILERFGEQVETFTPRYVIPFASFVWFCHEENWFMNRSVNRVSRAVERIGDRAVPVVLYPGDVWDVGTEPPTATALERYAQDYATVAERPRTAGDPVSLEALREAGDAYRQRNLGHHGVTLRALTLAGKPAPASVWLTDLGRAVRLNLRRGVTASSKQRDDCDVALSSAALLYLLQNMWGGNTLIINGRFARPAGGDFEKFLRYVRLGDRTNHGKTVKAAVVAKVAAVIPFVDPGAVNSF
jgi:hypothetical protein